MDVVVNGYFRSVLPAVQIFLKISSNVSGEKIKLLQWGAAAWTTNTERYNIPGLMNGTTDMPSAENTSRAALIVEAENRLQFNVFVSIFFCTLLYSFFRSLDKPDVDANKILVHWAAVPASYLLCYVSFEYGRSVITEFWLKCIRGLVLMGAALFVLPMILMAFSEAKWFRIELLLGVLSLWGVAILARSWSFLL